MEGLVERGTEDVLRRDEDIFCESDCRVCLTFVVKTGVKEFKGMRMIQCEICDRLSPEFVDVSH